MELRQYAPEIASAYDRGAGQYRRDDEVEARSENHQRIGGNLRRICRSFARPLRVLEIGCGTGRYFHWLHNVKLLVGTDLSAEMLKLAEQPVLGHEVTAKEIRLIRGNIYEMTFEDGAFDFIYSFGVFGYGAALTPALGEKLHAWLAPGGRLYFDAIEVPPSTKMARFKKRVRSALYVRAPQRVRHYFDSREAQAVPTIRHTREMVEQIMQPAGFGDFMISSNYCHSPLWNGVHLECLAQKSERVERPLNKEDQTWAAIGAGP